MFRNYLKITLRNLARNKGFSLLNITGLAIGMASALLILLWVQNEVSYDRFYPKAARLYQAWNNEKGNNGIKSWNNTSKAVGPGLKLEYPEVEQATRVNWDATILFTIGDKNLNVTGTMVDPDFLTMFEFPLIRGNLHTALNNPNDIIVTEKLAKQLFGNAEAMGKVIRLDNKYNFTVSAVMKDLPNNTQFDFTFLLPWSYMRIINQDDSSWGRNSTHNYVLLRQHTDIVAFNKKIENVIIKHGQPDWTTKLFLYPVTKLRLYSNFENGVPSGGRINTIKVFTTIAILILLIACINFMNMSTARSERRAREVGIRKVIGALRTSLIFQFVGESILISLIAGIICLMLVQLALPAFNTLTKQELFIAFESPLFWILFVGFILFTGIIAGSYPAFYLSSFRPVLVLKGGFKKVNALVTPRKILVIVQFTFAITLIVCTIIIEKQVKYAQDREAGYDKNNIAYTFIAGDINKNYELIRSELISTGIAKAVSKTSAPLTEGWSNGGADWDGKDPNDKTSVNFFSTDGNLVAAAGLTLVKGRDIDLKNFPTDSSAIVLNEAAVRLMGFRDPIGKIIDRGHWGTDWHVVGVVKDFILQSPFQPIAPMVIQGPKADWFNLIHVKLNGDRSTAQNIAGMEKVFRKYNPNYPFEYHFINEQYEKKFNDEKTTGTLSTLFSGLTIFISCLGLFGLAAYMAESRKKEIGVRKILGASVRSIATLLSRDFVKLVIISMLIASPIAYYTMTKWLADYPYHIAISWWIFAAAGCGAIIIALMTVSFQSLKAAIANPVKSLRAD